MTNVTPSLARAPARHVLTQVFDSARWSRWSPRPDDIIVSTYPKCGTTWTQRVLEMLITQDPTPKPITVPWYDMRLFPFDPHELAESIQGRRRQLKAHLPYDALPIAEGVKIIHVARDGRDSAMSMHNHMLGFLPHMHQRIIDVNRGGPLDAMGSTVTEDPGAYFTEWLEDGGARGDEGAGFWHLEKSFWAQRRSPDVLLVHFNDMKEDLDGEMHRIARFLNIPIDEARWPALVEAGSFASMKRDADALMPSAQGVWEGGGQRFIHKGTNGRWQDCVSKTDLARYDEEVRKHFSPALAKWIETGRLVAGDPETSAD